MEGGREVEERERERERERREREKKEKDSSLLLPPSLTPSLRSSRPTPIQGGQVPGIHPPVTKSDVGTQTDTHLMESNIVKSYDWNEWELRRKAIKLVSSHLTHPPLWSPSVCVCACV